ncbi:MAG: aminoacyl-tRNA hydrolase [Ruminococcaceae bacterium]|nr:aminoacyl-tRNA hydrolase [Oscillospiraceae bacterium]
MYNTKMIIVMRRDLKMRKGKIAAQAGHAAIEAALTALKKENRFDDLELGPDGLFLRKTDRPETPLSEWFNCGQAKICVYVDSEDELTAIAKKAEEMQISASVITDAGATEFHGIPTKTCLALEPMPSEVTDAITGHLPLY